MSLKSLFVIPVMLLAVLFLQAAPHSSLASSKKTATQEVPHSRKEAKKNKKASQLTFGQRLMVKIVSKKIQKQQKKTSKSKARNSSKYGGLSLICLVSGILLLIFFWPLSVASLIASAILGLMGLKRDADPKLAKISLIVLGSVIGLVLFLGLLTLIRIRDII